MNNLNYEIKKGCPRCETLPEALKSPGYLYYWFPIQHSMKKIHKFLNQHGFEYAPIEDSQTLMVRIEDDLEQYVKQTEDLFSSTETKDIRCIYKEGTDSRLQISDMPMLQPYEEFVAQVQSEWLVKLLQEERFTSYFQPIVHTRDHSNVFAYECLLRGLNEDGSLIPPYQIFQLARQGSLLFQLDQMARRSAIKSAAKNNIQEKIFINFNPVSIYDPVYCLQSTFQLIKELGFDHTKIVFEVVETDKITDSNHLMKILAKYKDEGFQVALDDVGSGYSSLTMIQQLKPDFVKINRELISNIHQDRVKSVITSKIIEIAHEIGISTIAEGIESEEEANWLETSGADYMQGYYIAKPSSQPWKPV